ncbi:MAG: OmpH family outer membrane protein [Saprospiraceae bacterium]
MKNLSLILNILLLIAVAYLFMDKFSGGNDNKAENASEKRAEIASSIPHIVYLNADTLLEKYDKFRKAQEELNERERTADASLKARGRALEKEAMELAQRAQTGTMTRKEMEEADMRLRQKQQTLLSEQDQIAKDLMESGNKINDELHQTLQSTLDSIKNARGYTYVLSYGTASPVLSVVDSLDITSDVLSILNAGSSDKK